MTAALWPDSVQPSSFSRLARWLEMGPDWLAEWRVSATRAGAEMALRFALSRHPDLQLDALMGQRAGSEQLLQEQAGRIASRASYIAEFAFHDEFHPERTEDGRAMDGDAYGLLLHDPEGSSEETGVYHDAVLRRAPAPRWTRRPSGESRRCHDAALEMPETLRVKSVK